MARTCEVDAAAANECDVRTIVAGREIFAVDVVADGAQQLTQPCLLVRPDRTRAQSGTAALLSRPTSVNANSHSEPPSAGFLGARMLGIGN